VVAHMPDPAAKPAGKANPFIPGKPPVASAKLDHKKWGAI